MVILIHLRRIYANYFLSLFNRGGRETIIKYQWAAVTALHSTTMKINSDYLVTTTNGRIKIKMVNGILLLSVFSFVLPTNANQAEDPYQRIGLPLWQYTGGQIFPIAH
jgi:hypothetical protein